jgi:hypothetical protein
MGVRLEQISHLWKLMSPADQARYGAVSQTVSPACDAPKRSPKRDADERKQQGDFANWLSLQNSKGHKIPYVWHAMHKPSKATIGCPDFYVGIIGHSIWIEFKRDSGCRLTP